MPRQKTQGAFSWALYDLANTIFSMNVVTLFFVQWVTVDRGREYLWFSLPYGASMLLVALSLPYLGVWSDRGGLRLRFLGIYTVVAVGGTALLGWFTTLSGTMGLALALAVFALANYGFQGGLVFYNSLLPLVSTPRNRGWVSGLGVGLGYVGSFLGMLLVVPFVDGTMPLLGWEPPFIQAGGRTAAFFPTAILFGLFSLPLFLRVREPKGPAGAPRPSLREATRDLWAALADARRYPGVKWFLLGNFFVLDAIHTAIVSMALYAEKVVGLPDSAKAAFFMVATIPAIFGSLVAGALSDRFGPRRVFLATAWLWVLCPIVIALTTSTAVFYTLGGVTGMLLGSLWTTTRPLLLSLTPEGEEGRLFGLYALCNKSAAVLGPQIFGVTVLLAAPMGDARYRLGILVLSALAAVGAVLLHRIPSGSLPREPRPRES